MDLHEIAKEIAGAGDAGLHLRQGVVSAIAADGTLTVTIAGSSKSIAGVHALSSAGPVVGSAVWLAVDGPLVLAIGSVGAGGTVPPGVILDFGGTTAPAGYLLCNGAAVSRTTYATLFAAISTNYGVGDGSTTFNIPDARDRFRVGAGASYSPGNTGGSIHMPAHNHEQYVLSNPGSGGINGRKDFVADGTGMSAYDQGCPTATSGTGPADENRPPYLALTAIIKT